MFVLVHKKKLSLYVCLEMFLGRFEVESIKPENPAKKSKIFIGFSMKNSKNRFFRKIRKTENLKNFIDFPEKS